MKKILSLMTLVLSFSAFASMPIDIEVFENDCYVEVLEPLVLLHSSSVLETGNIQLTPKRIDHNNHRQLSQGRIIRVRDTDRYTVRFYDNAMRDMCFVTNNGMCAQLNFISVEDIEIFSNGTLRMVCQPKQIIEM